ncbi:hypothetical protein ABTN52_19280, partial [Acinetobacter baumannii]
SSLKVLKGRAFRSHGALDNLLILSLPRLSFSLSCYNLVPYFYTLAVPLEPVILLAKSSCL